MNSDLDDDGPDTDIDVIDEFPDIDFDEQETKNDNNEDNEKILNKSGDSLQSSMWINSNERDLEDLKKCVNSLYLLICSKYSLRTLFVPVNNFLYYLFQVFYLL